MDLYTVNVGTFLPETIIEGYSSLIWHEKYRENSQFEIHFPYPTNRSDTLLHSSTIFTLIDSTELMRVQSISINAENDNPEIVYYGQSLTSAIDKLLMRSNYGSDLLLPRQYTARDAALLYLWNGIANSSAPLQDVAANPLTSLDTLHPYTYRFGSNAVITDSAVTSSGSAFDIAIKTGLSGPQIREWLSVSDDGLRIVRPNSGSSTLITTTTSTSDPNRGLLVRTSQSSFTKPRFDVYSGLDRSANIVFSALSDDLENVKTIYNRNEILTGIYIRTNAFDYYYNRSSLLASYDVNEILLDGGTVPTGMSNGAYKQQLWNQAQAMLNESKREAYNATGDVAPDSAYKFGTDYFLGDIVRFIDAEGVGENVRITGYVRTEDENGESSYPEFGAILS